MEFVECVKCGTVENLATCVLRRWWLEVDNERCDNCQPDDPTYWCAYCRARTAQKCTCGPIARND